MTHQHKFEKIEESLILKRGGERGEEDRRELLYLVLIVVARGHPFGIDQVRATKQDPNGFLQIIDAQTGLLRKDVCLRHGFNHVDDEDVANQFEQRCRARLLAAEIYDSSTHPVRWYVSTGTWMHAEASEDDDRECGVTYTPTRYGLMRSTCSGGPAGTHESRPASAMVGSPNTDSKRQVREWYVVLIA